MDTIYLRIVFVLISSLLVAGCASSNTVKQAQGQGVTKTYAHAYDDVYAAVLQAADRQKLKITEADKDQGRILLANGISPFSWGERVAVFIVQRTQHLTDVEIVSKPVMAPLNFPPKWEQRLFDEIGQALKTVDA